jgi:uncharacterized protein (DUF1015 family)
MATIYPFRPLRPNPFDAGRLVFTKPQTESVAGEDEKGLLPLKTLLETGARQRPESMEGQSRAYANIMQSLDILIEQENLWREPNPSIYIYESSRKNNRQTGVWALTDLHDYAAGNIRIHELTFGESVRRIKNYRRHTGLEGSPVLLTYPAQNDIEEIIRQIKAGKPDITYGNARGRHRLWKVEDLDMIRQLVRAFAAVTDVYLADGHHRQESALQLAVEQTEAGLPVFGKISSLYMSLEELRIERYDRVVIPDERVDPVALFRQLCENFHLLRSVGNIPVEPTTLHNFGMCLFDQWYHLQAKVHTYEQSCTICSLDAAILQDKVLAPVFGIEDPKTDQRLICAGGEEELNEIALILQREPQAIVFTLCPLSKEQLVAVADAGGILPPKSTWIVPKIPYGLLIQKH